MIIDLAVKNFLSIKDEQLFSMHADRNLTHLAENLAHLDTNYATVRTSAILGSNASGKTNLLFAIKAIVHIVCDTHKFDRNSTIRCYDPFILSSKTKETPSELSIEFWLDETRHIYSVAYDSDAIYKESLYYYPSSQPAKIFDRESAENWKEGEGISFGTRYKGGRKQFAYHPNMSYLSVAGSSADSPEMIKRVYDYFNTKIIFDSSNRITEWEDDALAVEAMTTLMSSVDLGISHFRFEDFELTKEQLKMLEVVPKEFRNKAIEDLSKEVIFSHLDEEGKAVEISNSLESKGTIRLFKNFPNVLAALKLGTVLIIDEIEISYHAHVVELMISLFQDPEVNVNNAQLIFTTHAFHIIKSSMMRKDQIWLAQKVNGASDYVSLEQFDSSLRDNSPFDKWYDEGRLGGIPAIDYKSISNSIKKIVEG